MEGSECPRCGEAAIAYDSEGGCYVCQECGFVPGDADFVTAPEVGAGDGAEGGSWAPRGSTLAAKAYQAAAGEHRGDALAPGGGILVVQGGAAGGRLVRVRVGGDGPAAQRALRHARQLSELQGLGSALRLPPGVVQLAAGLLARIHHRHQQGQCSAEPCAEGEDELQREGSRAGEGQGSGGGQGRREMGSAGAGAGAGAGSGAASGGKRQGTAGAGGGGGGRAAYGSAEHPGPGVPGGGGDSQGVEEAGAGAVGGLAAAPGKRRCVEGEGPSGASPGGAEGSGGDTGGYSSDVWDEGTDDTDAVEDGRDGGEGSGSGQGPDDGPAGEEGSRCRRFLSVPPTGGSLSGGRLGCLLYLAARAERQSLGLAEVAAATACDMSRLARIARHQASFLRLPLPPVDVEAVVGRLARQLLDEAGAGGGGGAGELRALREALAAGEERCGGGQGQQQQQERWEQLGMAGGLGAGGRAFLDRCAALTGLAVRQGWHEGRAPKSVAGAVILIAADSLRPAGSAGVAGDAQGPASGAEARAGGGRGRGRGRRGGGRPGRDGRGGGSGGSSTHSPLMAHVARYTLSDVHNLNVMRLELLDRLVSYGARLPFGPLLTRANVLHHVEVILAADRALQAADREDTAP